MTLPCRPTNRRRLIPLMVFAHLLSSLSIAASGTFLMRLESRTMQGDWLRARCTRLLRSHQRGPAFRTFRIPASGGGACLRSAMGAPLRLRRGRRGERIGTFPRRFRGRDQVGWPWFEVETGPDGRAQSIAARQLLVA